MAVKHSRFDRGHYLQCEPCYDDHIDFIEQCRLDEIEDAKIDEDFDEEY